MTKKCIYLLLSLFFATGSLFAQSNKSLAEAERYFGIKSYDAALPKYLEAIHGRKRPPGTLPHRRLLPEVS